MKRLFLFTIFIFCFIRPGLCEDKWQEYRSLHFLIYYKDAPRDFVEAVQESAEDYYQEITQELGFTREKSWSFDERAKIYIYRDSDDYIKSGQADWSHGAAIAKEKTIRTFPQASGFFDTTLPHELGHIIFREFVGFRSNIPLWMDEGVAMYQEKAKRWGANQAVRGAISQGAFVPVPELTDVQRVEKDFVPLFYAESASLVYYLITEFGKYKFVSLCKMLKGGTRFENAFIETYSRFKDFKDVNDSWLDYLNQ